MATIRSHLMSLFSGGIFPDKKWWLSCFCLPRSKEEKSARRPSKSNEKVIYTIQINEDQQPNTEFDFVQCLGKNHSSLEKLGDNQFSEIPLANGCHALLLDGQIQTKDLKHIPLKENHEKICVSTFQEESSANLSPSTNSDLNADCSDQSSRKPESSEAFVIWHNEDSLLSETDSYNRYECVFDRNENSKDQLTKLWHVTESVSDNIVDKNIDQHHVSDTAVCLKVENLQHVVSYEKSFISEKVARPLGEIVDQSVTDISRISSDLETSGIQSNSVNCEDTTLHLSSSYDNLYESTDDSDANVQFASPLLISSLTSDKSVVAGCESFKVSENQSNTAELPVSSEDENDNLSRHSNEVLLCPIDYVASSLFQQIRTETSVYLSSDGPSLLHNDSKFEVSENKKFTEMSSDVTEEKMVQTGDHDYCAALYGSKIDFKSSNQWSCQNHSDDQSSYCSDLEKFVTNYKSDDKQVTQMVAEKEGLDCDAAFELEIQSSRNNNASNSNVIELNTCQRETVVAELESCDHAVDLGTYSVNDDRNANTCEKINSSCNIEGIIEKDVVGLPSLLQVKLLFRTDSYEMLESIANGLTLSLLKNALDQLLSIKCMRENISSPEKSENLQSRQQHIISHDDDNKPIDVWNNTGLPLMNERDDPFLTSSSGVFEDVLLGNYEQISNSEEWLDDDFGFSSAFEGKLPPPYPDSIVEDPNHYSSIFLCLPDLDYDNNGVFPELSIIELMPEKIFPMVDQATDVFWSSRRYGEPWNEVHPPETYFTSTDYSGTLEDCSRKSHKVFLFDLVAEILQGIYSDELIEIPYPWQQVNGTRSKHSEKSPTTIDVLKPVVRNHVLQSLKRKQEHSLEKMRKCSTMRRQVDKRDFVDKLLINEMYHEEPGWTDYSKDANLIKNNVANKLFYSLINDTAMVLKLLHSSHETKCD